MLSLYYNSCCFWFISCVLWSDTIVFLLHSTFFFLFFLFFSFQFGNVRDCYYGCSLIIRARALRMKCFKLVHESWISCVCFGIDTYFFRIYWNFIKFFCGSTWCKTMVLTSISLSLTDGAYIDIYLSIYQYLSVYLFYIKLRAN